MRIARQTGSLVLGVVVWLGGSAFGAGPLDAGRTDGAGAADASIVVYAQLEATASAGPQPRVGLEPNDTLATAYVTGLVGDGSVTVIGATIGNGDYPDRDVDLYRFEIPSDPPGDDLPKLLTATAEAGTSGLDAYVRVFDESGQEIANNDDLVFPNPDPLLRTYLLAAGIYYVGVSAAGNAYYDPTEANSGMDNPTAGTYDLFFLVQPALAPDSALEPNDSFDTATDTGGGSYQVFGEFIGDGTEGRLDIDVYRITLSAPAIVQADVLVQDLDSTLEPRVSLRSPSGTFASSRMGDLDTYDAWLEAALFEAGDYYLVVSGAGNVLPVLSPELRLPGSVGYYDLSIEVTPLTTPAGAFESNDSILEATTTGLSGPGEVTLSAYIGDGPFANARGDVDFYDVQTYPGDLLTIDVDAAVFGSELDSVVVVYDWLGRRVAANDNSATTDSYLTVEAVPVFWHWPPWEPLPSPLYVMVMGTRGSAPTDPLVPNPESQPDEARQSQHIVVPTPSSAGAYEVTFTLVRPPPHDCCETDHGPGCSDPDIEACVCSRIPECCTHDWAEECVERLFWGHCGVCPPDDGRRQASAQTALPRLAPPAPSEPGSPRRFGTPLVFPSNLIVEFDPHDGSVLNSLTMPENVASPAQSLAVIGDPPASELLFLGTGRFPRLYWLDPDTGDVFDDLYLWSGSGFYGDLAVAGGQIYVSDLLEQSVHELDPVSLQVVQTLQVGLLNGITLSGAMASLAHPSRLLLADAFGTGSIYAVSPTAGQLDGVESPGVACPCSADFDGDGDVDADDQAFYDDCDAGDGSVRFGCGPVDLDCDGDRDEDDEAILDCQENGPDQPPAEGCCPEDLPPVPIRATALGGSGRSTVFANDWRRSSIEVYDAAGGLIDVVPTEAPFAALGGAPFFYFADGDEDADVDSDDFTLFADCLTGPGGGPVALPCRGFDAEPDNDVDLDDFAALQLVFAQGADR